LDSVGNNTIAYCGLGKTLWDFADLGLPFCLDVAHLGANLQAVRVVHQQGTDVLPTDQRPYRFHLTDREKSLGRTLVGLSPTQSFLRHLEVLPPRLLQGVHLSNCRGFALNADGWLDGDLDLVLILETLARMDPDYLVPEIQETDYTQYARNRLMMDAVRGVLSRVRETN
jgi:hypothetical protein